MNWLSVLAGILKLVPYVVAGVNQIHTDKDTATKTQLAKEALGMATATAAQVLSPDNGNIANAVSGAVSASIDAAQLIHESTTTATK